MPIEAKPLFRPDVLRAHLKGFELPDQVDAFRPKLALWAELLSSGRANTFTEQEILPDFLTDFFCELLGYTRPAVDFGHAKQIFEEVDVFPSIIVARRPADAPKPETARLCTIPREQLRIDDLSRQVEEESVGLPLTQLGADAWQLEPAEVSRLLAKIKAKGVPLADFVGATPFVGIKTA